MNEIAYIGLGSNIGDRETNIFSAKGNKILLAFPIIKLFS